MDTPTLERREQERHTRRRRAEQALDHPFDARASLRLDRLLVEAERDGQGDSA
jgi:hypothetical protein